MRNSLINLGCGAFEVAGGNALVRRALAGRRVTVINYHDPAPEVFAAHLKYWRKHYNFISVDALHAALTARDFSPLPDCPLLISFDDGHAGNYALLPLLREYRVPAVIYVSAGLTDTRRHFWWLELRGRGLGARVEELKRLPDREFRERLRRLCGFEFEREYPLRQALSSRELLELRRAGVTIGAHSVNHPLLDKCGDEELKFECAESKKILQELLQCEVRHFALPNGNGGERVCGAVAAAGFVSCRTIVPGWNEPETPPMAIKDFGVGDRAGVAKAALQAGGVLKWLKH